MNPLFEVYSTTMAMAMLVPSTEQVILEKSSIVQTVEKPIHLPARKYYSYVLSEMFLRDVAYFESQSKETFSFEFEGTEEEQHILKTAKNLVSQLKFLFPTE